MKKENTAKANSGKLGIKDLVGYTMGDFGCNMSFQLIGTFLITFVTQGLEIKIIHWSLLVILSKIFDAINDPIIGAIVDARKTGKHGKYIPWIFFSAFAIAITTTLLFIDVRGFSYWGRFVYVLLMYCVWSIAYTAANVPYGSLNAALTDDPSERSMLSSLRSIGAGVAMLILMVAVPFFIYGDKDPATGIQAVIPEAFVWVALVCSIIAIVGFMLTCFLTKEKEQVEKPKVKFNYLEMLKRFLKNRAALGMCLASFCQLVFIMSYSTTLPLVCQLFFGDAESSGMVSIVMMAPMVIFIPLMGKLSAKYGKKEIAMWPNVLSIAVFVIMLFIPFPRESWAMWVYALCLGVGQFATAPLSLGTWSMVADCVDEQEVKATKGDGKNMYATYLREDEFGNRDEASVYATYSFVRKAAQGIGAAFVAAAAGWVGYEAENYQATTPEVADNLLKLSIALPLAGAVLVFASFMFVYNLNKKKVLDNTEFLRAKNDRLAIRYAHGPQPDDGTDEAEVIDFDGEIAIA